MVGRLSVGESALSKHSFAERKAILFRRLARRLGPALNVAEVGEIGMPPIKNRANDLLVGPVHAIYSPIQLISG
ncbi:hypothetical protein RMSM_06316 [Rhodopirellula maiorica SM1]|uniref:Uncharacterized protein n=1 Tax=Rhodopirellula maiorica SM1 TaxID=1265738 RepID=M5RN06_9BACT|nr:hypothetical protein RMSM_06316 [Rhodopirellula maiorica SM1]